MKELLPQPPWEGPPVPRGPKLKEFPSLDTEVTLYHGTLERNLPSIRERGIVPLATTMEEAMAEFWKVVERVLAEYNLRRDQIPDKMWIKEEAEYRWVEELVENGEPTVYLTLLPSEAREEVLASLEGLTGIYNALMDYLRKHPKLVPPTTKLLTEVEIEDKVKREAGRCVVLTVRIPLSYLSPDCLKYTESVWYSLSKKFPRASKEALLKAALEGGVWAPSIPPNRIVYAEIVPCKWREPTWQEVERWRLRTLGA